MCPRPRFQNLDPAKREAILAAAAEEFARNGFDGASLNAIIDKAGLSKGAMYYYFDDKADLFATVLLDVAQEMSRGPDLFGAMGPGEDFWAFMDRQASRTMEYLRAQPQAARLMWCLSRVALTAPAGSVVGAVVEQNREGVRMMLRHGQACGSVRTDLPLDYLVDVSSALHEVNQRWFLAQSEGYSESDVQAMVASNIGLLRSVLEPHSGKDATKPARKPAGGRR
jgi:AcrR family transcriptional regulator